jgi:hypothetical protein
MRKRPLYRAQYGLADAGSRIAGPTSAVSARKPLQNTIHVPHGSHSKPHFATGAQMRALA